MTTENAVKPQKKSNRALQREQKTYSNKSEISEALHILQPYINVSTYKFLSHFLYTQGTGSTQMSITEWCKRVGISLGSYHKTVKPEIETMFSQPLIIKTPAPMKYDKKRKKKVRASEFKSLQSLRMINILTKEFDFKERQENEEYWEQFSISEIESEIEGEIEGEIESIPPIPCGSKDEAPFSQQQNKSFREKPLEEYPLEINNRLDDKPSKEYKIKIDPKINEFVAPLPWDKEDKPRIAKEIQLVLNAKGLEFNDDTMPFIFKGLKNSMPVFKGQKKLDNPTLKFRWVYKCMETALQGYFSQEEVVIEDNQRIVYEHRHYHENEPKKHRTFLNLWEENYGTDQHENSRKEVNEEAKRTEFKRWQEQHADRLADLPF